jgi:hypothetical protein
MRLEPIKHCGCRDPNTGKQYGSKCPRLKSKDHGAWWYRYEAPASPNGKRRQPWVGVCHSGRRRSRGVADRATGPHRQIRGGGSNATTPRSQKQSEH